MKQIVATLCGGIIGAMLMLYYTLQIEVPTPSVIEQEEGAVLVGDMVRVFTASNTPCLIGDGGNIFAPQFTAGQWAVMAKYLNMTNINVNVEVKKATWELAN